MKKLHNNIYLLKLGAVNAYLIDVGDLILIDTGYKGYEGKINLYIRSMGQGKTLKDIKHIIVTHHHPDHAGSLAAIKKASNAKVYMHPEDAKMVEQGIGMRENIIAGPGLLNKLLFTFFIKPTPTEIPKTTIDHHLHDGDVLNLGKGFEVIHLPGHSKGQVGLLYQDHGGFLFAADVGVNFMGIGYPPVYEDTRQGLSDLKRIGKYKFESAVFGHGNPILKGASEKFKRKYGSLS